MDTQLLRQILVIKQRNNPGLPGNTLHGRVYRPTRPPDSILNIASFLGSCNFLRPFVPNVARVASPRNKSLHEDQTQTLDRLSDDKSTT